MIDDVYKNVLEGRIEPLNGTSEINKYGGVSMNELTFESINAIANSPSAYLILFIFLLMYVLKTSSEREKQMREQLDKTIPILDRLVKDMEVVKDKILNDDEHEEHHECHCEEAHNNE